MAEHDICNGGWEEEEKIVDKKCGYADAEVVHEPQHNTS